MTFQQLHEYNLYLGMKQVNKVEKGKRIKKVREEHRIAQQLRKRTDEVR